MRKVINSLILLGTVALSGCDTKENILPPSGYAKYLEDSDNGFRRVINTNDKLYNIQLVTPEYMAVREFSGQLNNLDTSQFQARLNELAGHIFFYIKIKENQQASGVAEGLVKKADAEAMAMYYLSDAANDITLIQDDSLAHKPVTYLFENNYSLVDYNTIVVGFEQSRKQGDIELVFNDRYNNNPFIKAKYSLNELNKLPGLRIK